MAESSPTNCHGRAARAGCGAEVMAEAANETGVLRSSINFGSPIKKVVNGHAGSALMRDTPAYSPSIAEGAGQSASRTRIVSLQSDAAR